VLIWKIPVLRTDFFGYANHLWLLGGSEKNRDLNDIWHTTDGRKWIEVLADIAWPPRGGHTSLSFNRRMWILGGGDAVVPKNDVWFCNDGTNWKQLHIETKWSPRFGHSSVIFKDKMWVIGGGTNDVWFLRLNK